MCIDLAQEAERRGFHSVWVPEWSEARDAVTQMTAIALKTHRILVGSGVSPIYIRTPILAGMTLLGLHEFTGGRAILGLGASHSYVVEEAHGLKLERPLRHMREYIEIIRKMLWEQQFSYTGEVFQIPGFSSLLTPIRSHLPIYVAALRSRMLQLAGEVADGVLLSLAPAEYLAQATKIVAKGARAVGKDPADVTIGVVLPACVSINERAAVRATRLRIARYLAIMPFYTRMLRQAGFAADLEKLPPLGRKAHEVSREEIDEIAEKLPGRMVDALAIWGSPEQCRQQVRAYQEAGAELLILTPIIAEGNWWGTADSHAATELGLRHLLDAFTPLVEA